MLCLVRHAQAHDDDVSGLRRDVMALKNDVQRLRAENAELRRKVGTLAIALKLWTKMAQICDH